MPIVAAFIDQLREAFGKDVIDQAIREGLGPDESPRDLRSAAGTFRASENGTVIDAASPRGRPAQATAGAPPPSTHSRGAG